MTIDEAVRNLDNLLIACDQSGREAWQTLKAAVLAQQTNNTGSPKLTAACGGCPLQYVCKGPSLFNTMACRGARSQLRAGA